MGKIVVRPRLPALDRPSLQERIFRYQLLRFLADRPLSFCGLAGAGSREPGAPLVLPFRATEDVRRATDLPSVICWALIAFFRFAISTAASAASNPLLP